MWHGIESCWFHTHEKSIKPLTHLIKVVNKIQFTRIFKTRINHLDIHLYQIQYSKFTFSRVNYNNEIKSGEMPESNKTKPTHTQSFIQTYICVYIYASTHIYIYIPSTPVHNFGVFPEKRFVVSETTHFVSLPPIYWGEQRCSRAQLPLIRLI